MKLTKYLCLVFIVRSSWANANRTEILTLYIKLRPFYFIFRLLYYNAIVSDRWCVTVALITNIVCGGQTNSVCIV